MELIGFDQEHSYPIGPYLICYEYQPGCTKETLIEKFPYHVVPNYNHHVGNGDISPVYASFFGLYIGRVQTFFMDNGLGAKNITLDGHFLRWGQVDLLNYQHDGAWYIAGLGSGTNLSSARAWLHEFVGPSVFSASLQDYIADVRSGLGR